ncbi:Kinase [Hexamita inflata]|uniref:CMGC CDK n=1 Tax=Hexamita inflata TaxID=28002 RepID=A0AA86NVA1_9EUKA|nr:CMGC CDK [Hexamita inflata]CAI9960056.1 CMGC CDK [Hexamita inflata]
MKIIKQIGEGGFGAVKLVQDESGETFAAKYGKLSGGFAQSTYNELQILTYFRQMNPSPAVELIRSYEEDGCIVLLLKKYPHDFRGLQRLHVFDKVYMSQTVFVFDSLAKAVHQMHRCGVVHRDLKSANVLLDETGRSHIADFGHARFDLNQTASFDVYKDEHFSLDPLTTNTLCTTIYRAPEQLFAFDSSNKAISKIYSHERQQDLYAMGVIFVEIIYNNYMLICLTEERCKDPTQAVKLAQAKLYGSDLIKMCAECYKMNPQEATQFIVNQFNVELQAEVLKLLTRAPINMKRVLNAVSLLRFKEQIFASSFFAHLDSFITEWAKLLSCLPSERKNVQNQALFKQDTQSIIVSLPEEGLDAQTQMSHESCLVDNSLISFRKRCTKSFNDLGCRYVFSDVIGSGMFMQVPAELKQYARWADVLKQFGEI